MSRGPRRNPGWVTPPPDFPDPLVGLADQPAPLPLEEVFGRRAPLEVEIGSGKGNTLVQLASERPDVDYLGIEIGVKWVRLSRARLIRAGLANVRVVTGDAQWILARHLPRPKVTSAADRIYKNMPHETDLAVFLRRGLPGLNLAFVKGLARYHTPLDDLEHLDPASL